VARDVERGGTAISDLLDWTLYTIVPTAVEILLRHGVLAYYYDWGFVWITFATLVAYVIFTVSITEWRTRYYRAAVEADTRANERAVDSLLNYETVKYFGNEEHEARRYDENLQHLENASVMSRKTLAVLNLGQTAIVALGVSAMMWRAAAGVVAGSMTVGDLVLVNAYLLQLSAPLNMLGMMYREVKQAMTNLERLFGLLDERQGRAGPARFGGRCTPRNRRSVSRRCASPTTCGGRSCAMSISPSRRGRRWRWSAIRVRQVDARAPAVPLLRRRRRAASPSPMQAARPRRPRLHAAICARDDRDRPAGHGAVQRHHLLQHRVRPPRAHARGSRTRGARAHIHD
jgi:ABC-type multidrug transport system fused ATPase/permease subunit